MDPATVKAIGAVLFVTVFFGVLPFVLVTRGNKGSKPPEADAPAAPEKKTPKHG